MSGDVSKTVRWREVGIVAALRGTQLFSGAPPEDLERVARITAAKSLARGEYLFREGEPSHGFYVVQTGAVNVHRVNAGGKEQVIHVFRAGESFAEATLASAQGYPADARAVETSQVLCIQKSGFLDLVRQRPELALRMLGGMSNHLRVLVNQLDNVTLKDVETRVAHWMLQHCPDPGSAGACSFPLKSTKRTLASELGTVSETLSRTFSRLRKLGLAAAEGKVIRIPSPKALQAFVERRLAGGGDRQQ